MDDQFIDIEAQSIFRHEHGEFIHSLPSILPGSLSFRSFTFADLLINLGFFLVGFLISKQKRGQEQTEILQINKLFQGLSSKDE